MGAFGQPGSRPSQTAHPSAEAQGQSETLATQAPALTLPKGGGAIRGIGEKFGVNPVTGTGSLGVPIATSPCRSGFGPQLSLAYDSGSGNGAFGLGWSLALPAITRKTDRGLPQYDDVAQSDVFILSGAEDLVPVLGTPAEPPRAVGGAQYRIQRYRPRVEGLFARIERWTNLADPADVFWRSISRENVTTWYGRTAESRIADPADRLRIFSWLICESYDDKGNLIVYGYKPENDEQIGAGRANERNRERCANRYPKRIRYGNHTPYLPVLDPAAPWPMLPADDQWYFELVFDYGEHDAANPSPQDRPGWRPRPDPFSSYRAGFEVRTYRLCQRALMFHHFPDQPEVGTGCLVRSTDLTYAHEGDPADARSPIFSQLAAVTQRGYQRQGAGYRSRSLPPVEFGYTRAIVQSDLRELAGESLENLPAGLDGARYLWVDLDGEGLPGILTEQGGAWLFKRNLSPLSGVGQSGDGRVEARLGPLEVVTPRPGLSLGGAQFLDLAGDGRPDVVQLAGPAPGFYERSEDARWVPFATFHTLPNLDWGDPNLRLIDLDGDGLADVLITEHDALVWHPSLAEHGFGPERRVSRPWDEERGPALVFADREQSISLADMSGDGLTDLVRIRNGEVCYWPNQGYGRFGPKVTMDDAPWFDRPEQFDQRRVRLADIDGSGTADIIYLHAAGPRIYFNQSGNGWGRPVALPAFPPADRLTSVQTLDLLGNGTACLVWSSGQPGDMRRPLRYIDLMGGQKPHLLTTVKNNLGAETEVRYAPSTKFYLQDKQAGRPWATKLPFPVHVVERVTARDRWRDTSFSSTYSYHHGFFDGPEREFRGFGRVEQVDVEDYGTFAGENRHSPSITQDDRLYQPPVKTVTWYHTGAVPDGERTQLQREYFPRWFEDLQPGQQVLGTFYERALPDLDLGAQPLTPGERREALRACKGMPLRQEIYELDIAALAKGREAPIRLFSATSHSYQMRLVQPQAGNRHAVFHVTESEAISYHYELDLRAATLAPDPRVSHTLNLKTDEYGNIQQAVTVGYPRWQAVALNDPLLPDGVEALLATVQGELHIAYAETRYTDDAPPGLDSHRLRLPCEVQTYELTGVERADAGDGRYVALDKLRRFRLSERLQANGTTVEAIPYHQLPDRTRPQKRLVEHMRALFFDGALAGPLPLGALGARALPYESYALALTDALLTSVLGGRLTPDVAAALDSKATSGYLSGPALAQRLGADTAGQRWRCGGVAGYSADAPQHFCLPERYTDPFGNLTLLDYDPRDLYVRASTDALGNRTEVVAFDFRVLAPRLIQDINGNRSEVRFDALGMPAAVALSGKQGEGDTLNGLDSAALNPDAAALAAFFVTDDYDAARAQQLLGGATSRHLYSFGEIVQNGAIVWGQHPPCAAGLAREQHASVQPDSPVQAAFEYSDGGGSVLVKKIQAEPELPNGPLRWVASGKTILNNKGKPVKQYEPSFSPPPVGHRFEAPLESGVTPVLFYDAVGRLVRTDAPDGSFSRAVFSPWHVAGYDSNDTVLEPGNTWYARMSASANPAERRAAQLAAAHADTPELTLLDSLGRAVVTVAHNRADGADAKHVTFTKLDTEGKPLWVQDARGNRVMQYVTPLPAGPRPFDDPQNLAPQGFAPCYDIAGQLLFQRSADAGDRWMLHDAAGKPFFAWGSRGFRSRMTYDALRRPVGVFVSAAADTTLAGAPRDPAQPPGPALLVERRVYGETHPDANANLRGKLYRVYDGAGVATSARYDFKGNLLAGNRRFARDYKAAPDWSALAGLSDPSGIAAAAEPLLEPAPPLISQAEYDALGRLTTTTTPDGSVYRAAFNQANLLERVEVRLQGAADATPFVTNIDYNAKGQRVRIAYGNGATAGYSYDPRTFRLTNLQTTRPASPDATASTLFKSAAVVQDLRYTYDPIGNITRIEDAALSTTAQAGAACDYRYDALYRLVAASGREHSGQTEFAPSPADASRRDEPFVGTRIHPNDLQGLRGYVERFRYDAVGNLLQLAHHAGGDVDQPGQTRWQRRYQYALDSNRLLATSLPGDPDNLPDYAAAGGYSAKYGYDAHGNITGMAHLPLMRWDFKDRLGASAQQVVNNGAPETTYYVYDAAGERARKVTETQTGARRSERLYQGGYEIYREYSGGQVALERETLHVMDDRQRIAIVETATGPASAPRVRYQHGNHLGSACVELDAGGALIAYEEYHPYGTTAFQAGRSAAEVGLKRYRYTGKERDDETGFSYHGARYYAPWLGRWASADPIGVSEDINLYAYVAGNPLQFIDPQGTQAVYPKGYNGPPIPEIEAKRKEERERWERENPQDAAIQRFTQEHPVLTTVIEGVQFAGSVIFIAQDINSLTSGVSMSRNFRIFSRPSSRPLPATPPTPPKTPAPPVAEPPPPPPKTPAPPVAGPPPAPPKTPAPPVAGPPPAPPKAAPVPAATAPAPPAPAAAPQAAPPNPNLSKPYSARDQRRGYEDAYGPENVTSTTVPAANHPSVRRRAVDVNGRSIGFDERGRPDFEPVTIFKARVEPGLTPDAEMRAATRQLRSLLGDKNALNGTVFTPDQMRAIRSGAGSIPGYTWEHTQGTELSLVPRPAHEAAKPHIGSRTMREGR